MEVPDATFDTLNAGLAKMHAAVTATGKKLDPDFKSDEGYPRTDPLQKAAVQGLALDNTIGALAKTVDAVLVKRAALEQEVKDEREIVAALTAENGHLLKGERPCKDCEASGKFRGEAHKPCSGTGWLPRSAGRSSRA